MTSNRANFLLHLTLAFFAVILAVISFGTAAYYTLYDRQFYQTVLAFACFGGSVWLFPRMIVHCIAAVGREVEQQKRRVQQREQLNRHLDQHFDELMRGEATQQRNGVYRRAA